MDSLSHPNGISDEPLKDIWGNDLAGEYSPAKGETKKEDAGNFKLDSEESEKYLLQPDEKYDKMYMANYSNEVSSGRTNAPLSKSLSFLGDNILSRALIRILGGKSEFYKDYASNVAQAIDEDRLKNKEEEGVIPEFHYTMGSDDIYRALEDWHHEQMSNK